MEMDIMLVGDVMRNVLQPFDPVGIRSKYSGATYGAALWSRKSFVVE
jgi:hypothetical protein